MTNETLTNLGDDIHALAMNMMIALDENKVPNWLRIKLYKLAGELADVSAEIDEYIEESETVTPDNEIDPINDPNNKCATHHY